MRRLAYQKAQAIKPDVPSWVIGSDQVALCNGNILTKPLNVERAIAQLSMMSGNKTRFITGLCLLNSDTQQNELAIEVVTVFFRELSPRFIENYITADQPFDCAAGFKVEARGLALVKKVVGRDLNSLVGLPLLRLVDMFANVGVSLDDYWC